MRIDPLTSGQILLNGQSINGDQMVI
ncbi:MULTISPECIES: hypothetical protein [unclassified Peribacillus]|nr:hypothetical protein [Peribacillus sp. Bi96]